MSRFPTTRIATPMTPRSTVQWTQRRPWRWSVATLTLLAMVSLGWWLGQWASAAESQPLTLGDRRSPALERTAIAGSDEDAPTAPAAEPLEPTIGADGIARPTLRLLAPAPGTLVTGQVEVRWEAVSAVDIEATEIRVDGRQIVRVLGDRNARTLDMQVFDDGPHVLEVTVYDANRRKGSQSVEIVVRTPSFALQRIDRKTETVRNGDELVLDVLTRGDGFVPRAELGPIDSGFRPAALQWDEVEPDRWRLTYRVTRQNRRPDGSYWMNVFLQDPEEPSISDTETVRVELANFDPQGGLRNHFEIPCAVYRPDPVPPASQGELSLRRIVGPTTGRVGESVTLGLEWSDVAGRDEVFLRVSADGVRGHYVLHGKCGLDDSIEVRPVAATGETPLRLAVWPSQGFPVTHRLEVLPE